MNSFSQAKQYVMDIVGLSNQEQNHLKQLLDKGFIIPLAVINSPVEDLKDIIARNPLQPNIGAVLSMILPYSYMQLTTTIFVLIGSRYTYL